MTENVVPVKDLETTGPVLLRRLVFEIYEAIELLNKRPKFVDNPLGFRLRDIEVNVDSANDHLYDALKLLSTLNDGKFINEKGGA